MDVSSDKKPINFRPVVVWLYTGCILIALMVVVGGITRLTQSGLSIVEWKLITGTLPPLSETEWQEEFQLYQNSPQYKLLNKDFTLTDFKGIYWWEYIHRLLGRIIGLVFFIPFLVFIIQGKLRGKLFRQTTLLMVLGGLQGFIGWIMVKSGLVDMPSVSHYRLALHLITAFLTFAFAFWLAREIAESEKIQETKEKTIGRKWINILFITIFFQIIYGAFVAGLKAGTVANTFPTMNGEVIPTGLIEGFEAFGIRSLFESPITVHFLHRLLAFLVLTLTAIYFFKSRNFSDSGIRGIFLLVSIGILFQFCLGVTTVWTSVSIPIAAAHQCGALLVWTFLWHGKQMLKR